MVHLFHITKNLKLIGKYNQINDKKVTRHLSKVNYAEKEVPHPQVSFAFGLLKLKPLF